VDGMEDETTTAEVPDKLTRPCAAGCFNLRRKSHYLVWELEHPGLDE
jgi:hypothetical protein